MLATTLSCARAAVYVIYADACKLAEMMSLSQLGMEEALVVKEALQHWNGDLSQARKS